MADRYGRPSPARRRSVIVVSGVVGVVALAWLVWAVWVQSTPQVQSSLRTFDVVDGHTRRRAVGRGEDRATTTCGPAACVRAIGGDHSVVGELTLRGRRRDGARAPPT